MTRFFHHQWLQITDLYRIFTLELKRIFRDPGVVVIFFLGTLAYPFIYKAVYWNEQIPNVPVAVVDLRILALSGRKAVAFQ